MADESKCARCGATTLEPGMLNGVYFRPSNAKFLTLNTGDIGIKANACTACGHIELLADLKKLAALTDRQRPW